MAGGDDAGDAAATPVLEPPRPRLRRSDGPTRHLFVANAGPIVGDAWAAVAAAFQPFGEVVSVRTLDPDKAQLLVTMSSVPEAAAGQAALHGERCEVLGGRKVWVQFSAVATEGSDASSQEDLWCPAVRDSALLGVPGRAGHARPRLLTRCVPVHHCRRRRHACCRNPGPAMTSLVPFTEVTLKSERASSSECAALVPGVTLITEFVTREAGPYLIPEHLIQLALDCLSIFVV